MNMAVRTRVGLAAVAVATGLTLGACGPTSPQGTPTPPPLSLEAIRQLYVAAATAYNSSESQIKKAENMYCDPSSAGADLAQCQSALGRDRQTTTTFDTAIRKIAFTGQAATDVNQLLADDAAVADLLQKAVAAVSLSAIQQMTNQIFPALNAAANDADKVRTDLGLPAPT
jgi:hypothetical protein